MRKLDGKFHITNDNIVNTSTGEIIPEDEPLFLLRAKDGLAALAIRKYFEICADEGCTIEHREGINREIQKFLNFERSCIGRVKIPD